MESSKKKAGRKSSGVNLVSITQLRGEEELRTSLDAEVKLVKDKQFINNYSLNEHVIRALRIVQELKLFNYETGNFDLSKVRDFVGRETGRIQPTENQ